MLERDGHGTDVTWHRCHSSRVPYTPHKSQLALQSLGFLMGLMCHGAEAGQAQNALAVALVQAVDMLCGRSAQLDDLTAPLCFYRSSGQGPLCPKAQGRTTKRQRLPSLFVSFFPFHCDDSNIYTF